MDSLSPYNGMSKEIYKHFKDHNARLIVGMLAEQMDYDATKQRPQAGPYVKQDGLPRDYLRRLEDIDESWIYKYLENTLMGLNINAAGGVRQYNAENRTTNLLVGIDGNELEETELLTEYQDLYTGKDIGLAKDKLPHILKRLHTRSKEMRVHLLSIIIAYERARKKLNGKMPSPSQILAEGVYEMCNDGTVGRRFTINDNNGKVFPKASKWIRGYDEERDSYFDNAMELLDCCDKLDVDITQEDPLEFQEDFISNLVVTYISKNKAYVSSKGRGTNTTVYAALKNIPLEAFDAPKVPQKPESLMDKTKRLADITMQIFLDAEFSNLRGYNKEEIDEKGCATFITYYKRLGDPQLDMSKLITRDGFFYRDRFNPLLINVSRFCNLAPKIPFALLHISGLLILLTDDNEFYFQEAHVLVDYIDDLLTGNVDANTRYQNNTKFGTWLSDLV